MAFEQGFKEFFKKASKKLLLATAIAVSSAVVLAILLKPNKVQAQTYEPIIEVDATNTDNATSDTNNQTNSNADDMCKDMKGISRVYCSESAFQKAFTGDPSDNRFEEQGNKLVDTAGSLSTLLGGYPEDSFKQAQSPFWQKVYASIPPLRKKGLVGYVTETTYLTMLYSPTNLKDTTVFYAQNFVPHSVLTVVDNSVKAGLNLHFLDTVGNPPSSDNAFSIINNLIGGWWLAIFKLTTGLFVLILIGAGIMIIIQQKVGQNTVTIYMALKNLVIGYVGGFLSFGFGAFFFNLSKWLMVIMARLIWSAWPSGYSKHVYFLDAVPQMATFFTIKTIGNWFATNFDGSSFLKGLWSVVKFIFPPTAAMDLIGLIIQLAIGIYALVVFTKLLIKVIKIYVNMLVEIVFAPIIFLLGAIPGNESTISDWFKRMLKASIKVPLMFFIVNFGMMFAVVSDLTLKNITGGAIDSGLNNYFWNTFGLFTIIPLTIIGTANGVDALVDQMWGGPSKTGAALAQGAKDILKGMPIIGGAMG